MQHTNKEINYKALRLIVGIIAVGIAIFTSILFAIHTGKSVIPTSISVTYHLGARDFFVGSLFAVGAFLIAYNGFDKIEKVLAKFAGVFAILVAIFPTTVNLNWISAEGILFDTGVCQILSVSEDDETTTCNTTSMKLAPYIHGGSAVLLIFILYYFCRGFAKRVGKKLKKRPLMKRLRIRYFIYRACSASMVLSVVGLIISKIWLNSPSNKAVFWVEFVCLWAFGISWLVASKRIPLLSHRAKEEDEADEALESNANT